jgi:Holliday junction resolvasome RuvABC endonuclease subunit
MIYIGIDSDTTQITIVELSDEAYIQHLEIKAKGIKAEDRFRSLISKFIEVLQYIPWHARIGIEAPLYIQNPVSTIKLSEIVGGCRALLVQYHNCEEVGNNTWKKIVLSNGKASKKEIMDFVINKYPKLKGCTQHLADSVGIALWRKYMEERE